MKSKVMQDWKTMVSWGERAMSSSERKNLQSKSPFNVEKGKTLQRKAVAVKFAI